VRDLAVADFKLQVVIEQVASEPDQV
jgi:hypothetical protein